MRRLSFLCPVLALLAMAPPTASAAFAIRGFVIANGGTPAAGLTGSSRVLYGTAGQPAVGVSAGTNHELCHGFWCTGGPSIVSVEDPPSLDGHLPATLALGRAYPIPARGTVTFAIDLPRAARVRLDVVDLQGRVIRTLDPGALDAGFRSVTWDGRDHGGRRAGAGVYFARLQVEGVPVGTRRVVLRD